MRRIKRRTFSGSVCEQEVFSVADNRKDLREAEPLERFKTEEDRAKHREGISRRHHERLFNATFSPLSLYSTLTMDNEHEVHTFTEARRIRDNYARRLKYAFPDAQIMLYMGRGKSTDRIHFHMVSNGVPEEIIRAKWQARSVDRIVNLRKNCRYKDENGVLVDHGQDYKGLANYLFDHWTPEQGGHRWKQTRNVCRPAREAPTVVKREYSESKPPRAPKGYKLVETKGTAFGYFWYKYVKVLDEKRKTKKR